MLKSQLLDIIEKCFPMLLIFVVTVSSIRIAYLIVKHEKFVFYKEVFSLLFMLYILILFYIVTAQDVAGSSIGTYNLIPFREVFRYQFGTPLFYRNIIGNVLIFLPFGLFVSYYLKARHIGIVFLLTVISSTTVEFAQRLIIGRVFDVDDIILNIVGGMLGYFLYVIIDAVSDRLPRIFRKDWFLNLLTLITIIVITIWIFNLKIMEMLP